MKEEKSFSIILTVWNLSDCIFQMLNSIEKQLKQPDEIIIIDDGSDDGSDEIIGEFIKGRTEYKFFRFKHRGVAAARNFGLKMVSTDYVVILDGDDILLPNFLARLSELAISTPDIIIIGSKEYSHLTHFKNSLDWGINLEIHQHSELIETSRIIDNIFYYFMGWAWDKCFRVEFLKENKLSFPKLENSEDLVFVYQALLLSKSILICKEALIYHRVDRFNSLSNCRNHNLWDFYEAIVLIQDFLSSNPQIKEVVQKCFNEWSADFSIWALKSSFINFREIIRKTRSISWESVCKTKSCYYPNLDKLINFSLKRGKFDYTWKFYYLLYLNKKFGSRRIILRLLARILNAFYNKN